MRLKPWNLSILDSALDSRNDSWWLGWELTIVAKFIDAAVKTAAHHGEGDLRRLIPGRRRSAGL